ncbi:DNA topology modulation protein FlaR [Parasedimentitalea marina]|uniref:DNA topology modulation protein FlaR n=1 Tax=Parasedimentitalea marina TaxID=2483033 RepID=UPI001EE80CC7|nr:DNA topology modulation protein FlaR [Parasedimentitalea marina]
MGKSHLAARLAIIRPEIPIVSFDSLKLKTDWQQRPRPEIISSLDDKLKGDAWILEGGPSMLPQAIARADSLVWLDPSEVVRAWRLTIRPWRSIGKTRPELPPGNDDWPIQQYRFAIRSLKNKSKFQSYFSDVFQNTEHLEKWHCRDAKSIEGLVGKWLGSAP